MQKFNRKGEFLLMFGGEVNKTKVEEGTASEAEENLCPFDPGDECKIGVQGSTGKGQFGLLGIGDYIAIDRTGADERVDVGDNERIQLFDTDGDYLKTGRRRRSARRQADAGPRSDPAGDLYAIYDNEEADVHKLTPAGKEATPVFELPELVALGEPLPERGGGRLRRQRLSPSARPTPGTPTRPDLQVRPRRRHRSNNFGKGEYDGSTGLATNLCRGQRVRPATSTPPTPARPNAFVRAYGTDPVGCFKAATDRQANPSKKPSATLNGTVNPKGEAVSECRFEYGTDARPTAKTPPAPGAGAIGEGNDPVPVNADIAGLDKGTVYHFRLVAKVGGRNRNRRRRRPSRPWARR